MATFQGLCTGRMISLTSMLSDSTENLIKYSNSKKKALGHLSMACHMFEFQKRPFLDVVQYC